MTPSTRPTTGSAGLRYLSVCSGIEAATVAWRPLGWRAFAYSEIEPFPCAVLEHHYPNVPNLGDMTQYETWPDATIDLLVGGTPCQSFSVAGLRKGLDDPRGSLMLTYGAIARKYRPTWLVWENVPGVLSSNGGRDFGTFLGMLAELGYGFAYRVLDAQHFGVPQRRRRVFVVGYLGDWRLAAAVLFERHSLQGHSPPRREAGERPAHTIAARTKGGGGLGTDFDLDGGLIASTLTRGYSDASGNDLQRSGLLVARCIQAGEGKRQDYETCTLVTHSLRGEGHDASEDGKGRGTPLVPVEVCGTMKACKDSGGWSNSADHAAAGYMIPVAFSCKDYGNDAMNGLSPTLRSMNHSGSHANAGGQVAVAVNIRGREGGGTAELSGEVATALRASQGGGDKLHALTGMQVRRLTPRECERLQGFPDDWTLIPWRGKPAELCPDGPRYKALGNSMAVPVMRWIGERIAMASEIIAKARAA
jgi:DNA (cytosine-5)-methyltransferase 1